MKPKTTVVDGEALTLNEINAELEEAKRKRDEACTDWGYYAAKVEKAKERVIVYQNRVEKLAEARDALKALEEVEDEQGNDNNKNR